jgi:hypothetical protein
MKSSLLFFLLLLLVAFVVPSYASSEVDITTTKVPNGTVETEYSAVINANGGCTPYKWALVSGRLPAGVTEKTSSNSTALDLRGRPTTAGSYSFTVSVAGCGGHVSEASYKIVVQDSANHVVSLKWDASTSKNIAGYNLYRGPDGVTWKKINTSLIASTDYDDSTVANSTTYYYSATTVNIDGEESSKSAAVEVSVPK